MAYKPSFNAPLGLPLPGNVDLVQSPNVPIGAVAWFNEDALGMGEYIYLPGVAATIAGDLVEYDLAPGAQATIRHSNATASNSGRPVAVATAAIINGTWGWFQISGVTIINTTAAQAAGVMMATATAGAVANGADAGDQILNARLSTATGVPAALKAYATIQRPFVQGQIT